ncbi:MAG: hypothetical protein ACI4QT_02655 [Kiritimatiellia bacterium]
MAGGRDNVKNANLFRLRFCVGDIVPDGIGTQEACLFLNHRSIMMAYRVYNVLKKNGALKRYAAVKTPETYLWEIRVTNVGEGWKLEPVQKSSRNALEALDLTLPENLPATPRTTMPIA